jgi:PAS domain S-box-containing protein
MTDMVVYTCLGLIFIFAASAAILFGLWHTRKTRLGQLEQQVRNYASIIEQANDAMLVIDIVDGRVHQCNPAAASLLGYDAPTLLTKSLFDLHAPEHLEKSASVIADAWEKGGLVYQDIPFRNARGEEIPVECSTRVAPFGGRPAIVLYARDITERLQLEGEIREKNRIIGEKSREILDSITYARRLQRSILPSEETMHEILGDHFVLYMPKDIVSGDFYWVARDPEDSGCAYFAAIDCTGHGVPGAFMSMVGYTLLNHTQEESRKRSPANFLDYLNVELPRTLKAQDQHGGIRDGMDMALCAIDRKKKNLQFAGANNHAWIVREGQLTELKGDKQAITASSDMTKRPFSEQKFALKKNDMVYVFTDGYSDQFGGPRGKKFMHHRVAEIFAGIASESTEAQKQKLTTAFEAWKGTHDQVDDVLVIGVRV